MNKIKQMDGNEVKATLNFLFSGLTPHRDEVWKCRFLMGIGVIVRT